MSAVFPLKRDLVVKRQDRIKSPSKWRGVRVEVRWEEGHGVQYSPTGAPQPRMSSGQGRALLANLSTPLPHPEKSVRPATRTPKSGQVSPRPGAAHVARKKTHTTANTTSLRKQKRVSM